MGQIVELQAPGMDCGACGRRIATVLGRIDGVGHVEADHGAGRVRVRFDAGRMTADMLTAQARERIEQAGFQVTGSSEEEVAS
ncbi:MAG: heavy-metal-associated domain-containing protein [Streptosporangiaceae bacterium]